MVRAIAVDVDQSCGGSLETAEEKQEKNRNRGLIYIGFKNI
jgi:hypothetical protein